MKTSTTKRKAIADAVELLKEESPNAPGNIAGVQLIKGIEDFIPNEQYQTDEYVMGVISDIKKKWLIYSRGGKFHAIFATSSIPEAVRYWRLMKKEMPNLMITAMFDPTIDNENGTGSLDKEDGIVDFTRSAASIDCKIRGFHVWPGASCLMEGKKLTLIAARPLPDEEGQKPAPGAIFKEYAVGKKPRFLVQCGQGILEILTLQLQGKKAMAASDFLRGIRALPDQLTSSEE